MIPIPFVTPCPRMGLSRTMNTFPSPIAMLAAKRAGNILTMGLPGGRHIHLSTYVQSWKRLTTLDPQTSVGNWEWYPLPAGDILGRISRGVHDRINRHLPWFPQLARELDLHRILRKRFQQGRWKCECEWCGQSLAEFQPNKYLRFCDPSCRHSYYG